MLAVDRLASDEPAPPGFAAYAVVTGLGSIGLAFANRRRARLGPWAWTIMLAWAGHLWAIVWLLNIELLPLVSLPTAAVVVLGALFLAGETLAIRLLHRRLHRAGLDRIDSAGRRG